MTKRIIGHITTGRLGHARWGRRRRRAGLLRGSAAVLLAAGLTACATSDDPAEGGFISGVTGLAGGGYDRRIEEREDAYKEQLDAQAALQAEARRLEQERAEVRAQLRGAESRLAAQARRIAAERRRIAGSGGAGTAVRLRQLDQAQARVDATRATVRTASSSDRSMPDMKATTRAIEDELQRIDDLVGVVAGEGF
jgi:chromosome segregation ATPase